MSDLALVVEYSPHDTQVSDDLAREVRKELVNEVELPGVDRIGAAAHDDTVRLLLFTREADRTWQILNGWLRSHDLLSRAKVSIRSLSRTSVDIIWVGEHLNGKADA